jgi:pimeloyl-ACP methyl ester carboxylesterase
MTSLQVEGFEPAVVSVPATADEPQPLLVATHGNFDRPEWQCEEWRRVIGGEGFVLCPRGEPRPDSPAGDTRFTYASNQLLDKELSMAIDAVAIRYASFVDAEGPIVYTGFSLGAITGVKIAARQPARFPRLVLVEGGHDAWTPGRAKSFAKGGGLRVLFVCAQRGCEVAANAAAKRLEHAGAKARVVSKLGIGHTYGGPLNPLIAAELGWLLEGDARWTARR